MKSLILKKVIGAVGSSSTTTIGVAGVTAATVVAGGTYIAVNQENTATETPVVEQNTTNSVKETGDTAVAKEKTKKKEKIKKTDEANTTNKENHNTIEKEVLPEQPKADEVSVADEKKDTVEQAENNTKEVEEPVAETPATNTTVEKQNDYIKPSAKKQTETIKPEVKKVDKENLITEDKPTITIEEIKNKEVTKKGTPVVKEEQPAVDLEEKVTTENLEIPFKVKTVYSNEVNKGETIKKQKGVNKIVGKQYKEIRVNGNLISKEYIGEVIVNEGADEIIIVGTKPVVNTSTRIETIMLPYNTITKQDANILKGEIKEEVAGVNGYKKVEITTTTTDGIVSNTTEKDIEVVAPTDKVVVVGIGEVTEKIRTEVINTYLPDKIITDVNMPVNSEPIVMEEGSPGVTKRNFKVTEFNGAVTGETFLNETIEKVATPKVIKVGAGIVETTVITDIETIDLDPIIIYNREVSPGEDDVIKNAGTPKKIQRKYEVTTLNGEETSKVLIEETTIDEGTARVIERGSAEISEEVVTERVNIELDPVYIYDNTLSKETPEELLTAGIPSVIENTYTVRYKNGVEVSREKTKEQEISKGKSPIYKKGTADITTETLVEKEVLTYNVVNEPNNEMFVGETAIKTKGENGEKETTYKITKNNGDIVSKEKVKEIVTKPIKDEVVYVGTKEKVAETPPVVADNTVFNHLISTDTSNPLWGIKKGDKLLDNRVVIRTRLLKNHSLDELLNMSDEEIYNLAISGEVSAKIVYKKDGEQGLFWSNPPLSNKAVEAVNNKLDIDKLNEEYIKLINEERASKGIAPVKYSKKLQRGASLRAKEQALIGNLRSDGKPHVRPNGEEYNTAFTYLNTNDGDSHHLYIGENIAQNSEGDITKL